MNSKRGLHNCSTLLESINSSMFLLTRNSFQITQLEASADPNDGLKETWHGWKDLLNKFTIFGRCAVNPVTESEGRAPPSVQGREQSQSQRYPLKRKGEEEERTSETGPQEHPDLLDELQQRDRCIAELRGPTKVPTDNKLETKWGLHEIHMGDSPDFVRARLPVIFCPVERTQIWEIWFFFFLSPESKTSTVTEGSSCYCVLGHRNVCYYLNRSSYCTFLQSIWLK